MTKKDQIQKNESSKPRKNNEDQEELSKKENDISSEIKEELDEILDEIDEVLETNAEQFVEQYIQKGGE
jgi:ubiquitin-like protein Pup